MLQYIDIFFFFDLIGTAIFSISGALTAIKKEMDLFGVISLGLLTAVGGGTIRDILLVSTPVFWINNINYIIISILFSVLTFIFYKGFSNVSMILIMTDAFGLSVFSVLGTDIALKIGINPFICILMGILTGTAGGVLRDIMANEVPLIMREELYATIAFSGGLSYLFLQYTSINKEIIIILSILFTWILRIIAIKYKMRLPSFSF